MALRVYTEEYIQDIADAIREKNRDPDIKYRVSQMGPAIRALPGGLDGRQIQIITTSYTTL